MLRLPHSCSRRVPRPARPPYCVAYFTLRPRRARLEIAADRDRCHSPLIVRDVDVREVAGIGHLWPQGPARRDPVVEPHDHVVLLVAARGEEERGGAVVVAPLVADRREAHRRRGEAQLTPETQAGRLVPEGREASVALILRARAAPGAR